MVPASEAEWMWRAATSSASSGAAPSADATVAAIPELSCCAAAFTCSLAATSLAAVARNDTEPWVCGAPPVSTTVTSLPLAAADRR